MATDPIFVPVSNSPSSPTHDISTRGPTRTPLTRSTPVLSLTSIKVNASSPLLLWRRPQTRVLEIRVLQIRVLHVRVGLLREGEHRTRLQKWLVARAMAMDCLCHSAKMYPLLCVRTGG